jgi:hypothetical protein
MVTLIMTPVLAHSQIRTRSSQRFHPNSICLLMVTRDDLYTYHKVEKAMSDDAELDALVLSLKTLSAAIRLRYDRNDLCTTERQAGEATIEAADAITALRAERDNAFMALRAERESFETSGACGWCGAKSGQPCVDGAGQPCESHITGGTRSHD